VGDIFDAFSALTTVERISILESMTTNTCEDVLHVPPGTKLSKLRLLALNTNADLICICDPDLSVNKDACVEIYNVAASVFKAKKEVIAYGIIRGLDNGSLISRAVALDKWISHNILRRNLWALGIGITIPGQFLLISTSTLRSLDLNLDTYLDDLYLGWIARNRKIPVIRLGIVVAEEEPRTGWGSLLSQRLRWMKGLANLFKQLSPDPQALALLITHYLAYHALPVIAAIGLVLIALVSPIIGLAILATGACALGIKSKSRITTVITYMFTFPLVHLTASLLFWLPFNAAYLKKR